MNDIQGYLLKLSYDVDLYQRSMTSISFNYDVHIYYNRYTSDLSAINYSYNFSDIF